MFINSSLLFTAFALFSSFTSAQSTATQSSAAAPSSSSSDSSTKAGWSGTLSSLSGGLQGVVKVVDPTTLMISNFKLGDASAPALYWWGAKDGNLKGGFRISNTQIKDTSAGKDITIKLDAGKTVADFATVGLWCERFGVDFGQTTLQADGGSSSSSGASPSSAPSPKANSALSLPVPVYVGIWAGLVAAGWIFL
ncbi:hypothetical protein GP486_005989 [Trichoglossum hirsutum]|uniref:DM13 domain-containing protein n=1 Tax=Trichoglossum hirsutum TaxID=265104 RepID=A0A9P8L877_9PEZI|nr:hypothetical protein GP486_005989 [Trichoglossum hirsutum]